VNSIIFRTAAGVLLPVMLILSIIVLLRGHNEPGGGFVGGLLAASAFSLHALAFGSADARQRLRLAPKAFIGLGLLTATLSGVPGLLVGKSYLHGVWTSVALPGFADELKLGTPLAFDIGVYLLVLGGVLLIVFTLEELSDAVPSRD